MQIPPLNVPASNGIAVASALRTLTFVPANFAARLAANSGSISTAVRRGTMVRRTSVVAP